MISLKLSTYTKEEVATLHKVIGEALKQIATAECNSSCATCVNRHVCYDLSKTQDYLSRETQFGFPHLRKS